MLIIRKLVKESMLKGNKLDSYETASGQMFINASEVKPQGESGCLFCLRNKPYGQQYLKIHQTFWCESAERYFVGRAIFQTNRATKQKIADLMKAEEARVTQKQKRKEKADSERLKKKAKLTKMVQEAEERGALKARAALLDELLPTLTQAQRQQAIASVRRNVEVPSSNSII